MGLNGSIEGSNPSFSVRGASGPLAAEIGSARLAPAHGEVSERSKERDWKSRTCCKVRRGFKSRPLRIRAKGSAFLAGTWAAASSAREPIGGRQGGCFERRQLRRGKAAPWAECSFD